MSETPENKRERCDDLLIQRALHGLERAEQRELDELIRHFGIEEIEHFEHVVGVFDSAFEADLYEANVLPEGFSDKLRDQIIEDAGHHIGIGAMSVEADNGLTSSENLKPDPPMIDQPWSMREIVLAFVTAASLLIATASFTSVWNLRSNSSAVALSAEAQLTKFRQDQPGDLRVVAWTNPTNDDASTNASGEVMWSDEKQRGFMVFDGLEINDPKVKQYQLWIFDKARDDALPVDGGVFDIAEDGEVIVPIDAKLAISEATMFAITIEQPGGVVQSKRERLPLLAKVD